MKTLLKTAPKTQTNADVQTECAAREFRLPKCCRDSGRKMRECAYGRREYVACKVCRVHCRGCPAGLPYVYVPCWRAPVLQPRKAFYGEYVDYAVVVLGKAVRGFPNIAYAQFGADGRTVLHPVGNGVVHAVQFARLVDNPVAYSVVEGEAARFVRYGKFAFHAFQLFSRREARGGYAFLSVRCAACVLQ